MIALAIALLGLPDLRQKSDLRVETTPAGATATLGDQSCTTPCSLKVVDGARIVLGVTLPGFHVTRETRTQWESALGFHRVRLAPPVVSYTLEPDPAP